MRKLQVVALGNVLLSDDGIGPHTLSLLRQSAWPPQVRFHSLGTGSLDAVALLRRPGRILLLDALQGGHRPGAIYRLRADRLQLATDTLSLHELHLLHLAARFYPARLPEITVLGLEPASVSPGAIFSREVRAALPLFYRLAAREIRIFCAGSVPSLPCRITSTFSRKNKIKSTGR